MKTVETRSYPVSIFIAGDQSFARRACRSYCDAHGLCVTVTPTLYTYTGGEETGVIVGLINYGRFPSEPEAIWSRAYDLALFLVDQLGQQSCSLQAPDKTLWISFREDASGIAARSDETPQEVRPEGQEPDPKGDAQPSPAIRKDNP